MSPYFGKYRGKVQNNLDPLEQGRIQVSAPAVLGGGKLSWAMPCAPYAGKGVGFYAIPPIGANIWVEFEEGDPNYPIWSGCFWGVGELPAEAKAPLTSLFKTAEITVKLVDTPGAAGFTVETKAGMKLAIGPEGVVIDNGAGSTLTISAEGIEIKQSQGSTVKLSPDGIQIDNSQGGTIELQGPKVAINKSALEVT